MIHLNKLSKTIAINLFLVLFLSAGNARATSDTLSDKEPISLFDYMHKEDQSHLRHLEIRKHVFLSNFSELIREQKKNNIFKKIRENKLLTKRF